MSDFIKREDAKKYLYNFASKEFHKRDMVFAGRLTAIQIKDVPSADVAPVRHGHWIKNDPHCDGLAFLWNCSECGEESDEGYRYCPACGARMDGENDEID